MNQETKKNLEILSRYKISDEAFEFVKRFGLTDLVRLFKADRAYESFEYKYRNWLQQAPMAFVDMAKNGYLHDYDAYFYDVDILMSELTFYDVDDQDDAKILKWRSQAPKPIVILSEIAQKYHQSDYPIQYLYRDYLREIREVFEYANFI